MGWWSLLAQKCRFMSQAQERLAAPTSSLAPFTASKTYHAEGMRRKCSAFVAINVQYRSQCSQPRPPSSHTWPPSLPAYSVLQCDFLPLDPTNHNIGGVLGNHLVIV